MTVEIQTRSVVYIGNDIADEFSFEFQLLDEEFLEVYLRDNATEVETLLEDSMYSVTFDDDGGTVTYPLSGLPISASHSIIIKRTVPYIQETEISNQGGFQPVVIEEQLDRIVMQTQQLAEDVVRAVKMKTGAAGIQFPSAEADKYLGWNAAGTRLENKTLAGFAEFLDEDDMASDSATAVPSQQSVKAYVDAVAGGITTVADIAALEALDTSQFTAAVLGLTGREGVFAFNSSDLSASVTADTAQGIYVAPSSDDTGASGAWVRLYDGYWNVKWFGALGDGSTNDVAAFAGVVSLAPTIGLTRVLVPRGRYRWATEFHCSKPILWVGEGIGEVSSSTLGSSTPETQIQWSGADAGRMCTYSAQTAANMIAGTTTGDIIHGGGFVGIAFNGTSASGYANTAIWLASTTRCEIRVAVRSFKSDAIIVDGGNGILSSRNEFDVRLVYGTAATTPNMNGIFFRRYNSFPSTQNTIWRVWGPVYDGAGVRFEDTDNNFLWNCHVTRTSGGTGWAIRFENGAASPGRFNTIFYVSGDVYAASSTYGNRIYTHNSEGAEIDIASGGHLDYDAIDYQTADVFSTQRFPLSRTIGISAQMMTGDGTVAVLGTTAATRKAIRFSESGTGNAYAEIPSDDLLSDGQLIGIRYHFTCENTQSSATVAWRMRLFVESDGQSITTSDLNEQHVASANNVANSVKIQEFTFGSPVSYTRGMQIGLRIDREPADAGDTVSGVVALLQVRLLFKSTGPNSGGSGPYDVGPLLI